MALLLVAVAFLAYGLVSRRLRGTVITAPLAFTGLGLLLGPLGLGLLTPAADATVADRLFELTLILVLFSDAFAIDAGRLVRERSLPLRLLAIGLPLTIGLGWAMAAVAFADLDIWEAALVGAVLAPTDASLAQSVIVDRRVPRLVRDGLNVESGLNDGIALPFVIIFIGLSHEASGTGVPQVVETFVRALVLSAALGAVAGWLGGRLHATAAASGWMAPAWRPLTLLATAVLAYGLATAVDGSGFIACWVAGLVAGQVARRAVDQSDADPGADDQATSAIAADRADDRGAAASPRPAAPAIAEPSESSFIEGVGVLLTTGSYLVFGALLLGPQLPTMTPLVIVFAVLALTVMRMIPVAVSLVGARLGRPTVVFVGWFGPRGLASIVFTVLIVDEALPGVPLITTIVVATVGLSVLLHGVSAAWAAGRYGAWYRAAVAQDPELTEAQGGAAVEVRRLALAGWHRPPE